MSEPMLPPAGLSGRLGPGAKGEPSIWHYLSVILKHRRLVVLVPAAAFLLTVVVTLLQPRQYVASAAFLPQDQASQAAGGLSQIAAQLGVSMPRSSGTSPQFYEELLQSRELLRDVVMTAYKVGGKVGFDGTLIDYFRIRASDPDERVLRAVERLGRLLAVQVDRNVGLVHFRVRTGNPQLSQQIADRLLELVNTYNLERLQSQAKAEREFVEGRLGAARDDLTTAENVLETFYARNRRFQDSPELVAEEGRLQRQVSLRQQIYVTLAQSYEMAKIGEVRNTPVITVVERPDGFVSPASRGVLIRALTLLLVAGVLSVGLAFSTESLGRSSHAAEGDYRDFQQLWRDAFRGLKRRRPGNGA